MRTLVILALLLASCSAEGPDGPEPGVFAGSGKDRLCISGKSPAQRGGLIAYANKGVTNCSMTGKIEGTKAGFALIPAGEGACRVEISVVGDVARVESVPAACAYYCGPAASLTEKTFRRTVSAPEATDLAGDPLC